MTVMFLDDLSGAAFEHLFKCMLDRASAIGFIWEMADLSVQAERFFRSISPHLLSEDLVTSWPGSQLPDWWPEAMSELPELRLYHYNEDVLCHVLSESNRLSDWRNPELPQDLHLLGPAGQVLFGSTTTEGYAWLEISHADWRDMAEGRESLQHLRVAIR